MAMRALENDTWCGPKTAPVDEEKRQKIFEKLVENGQELSKIRPCEQKQDLMAMNMFASEALEQGWPAAYIDEICGFIRKEIIATFLGGQVMSS